MNLPLGILLANAVSTFFMLGLIWMVQIVHYPLFDDVGQESYVRYQQRHQNNITLIVGPVMLIEIATAILMISYPVAGIDRTLVYVGLGLLVLIWISTAAIQVPCHQRLSSGFDESAYRWLVQSNWIRTIGWTIRSGLITVILARIISEHTK